MLFTVTLTNMLWFLMLIYIKRFILIYNRKTSKKKTFSDYQHRLQQSLHTACKLMELLSYCFRRRDYDQIFVWPTCNSFESLIFRPSEIFICEAFIKHMIMITCRRSFFKLKRHHHNDKMRSLVLFVSEGEQFALF